MEALCFGEINDDGSCNCENLFGEDGECILDLNDSVIRAFLFVEISLGVVLHLIGFVWAWAILIRNARGHTWKQIFTLNLHKVRIFFFSFH